MKNERKNKIKNMREICCEAINHDFPYDKTKIYYRRVTGTAERWLQYHGLKYISKLGAALKVGHTTVIVEFDKISKIAIYSNFKNI